MKNKETLGRCLKNIKEKNPLILGITNNVTINDSTNAILAIGGTAAMGDDVIDMKDFAKISQSLVINLGKLNKLQIQIIKESCKVASENNIPITLDPIGVSLTKPRADLVKNLITNYNITCIKGNISEIKSVGNIMNIDESNTDGAIGVDANYTDLVSKDNIQNNAKIIKNISKKLNTIIVASGAIDLISDGEFVYSVNNGDEMMSMITGSGCMLSTIIGTYISVNKPLIGALTGVIHLGIAGEKSRKYVDNNNAGTGTFRVQLIDNLYKIDEKILFEESKVQKII